MMISIQAGPEAGQTFPIPAEGVRIGRSSKNDIVLSDPLLSRYHCRLFEKDGGLWVTDLGSANQTLLNNSPVTETPALTGSLITIGDTVIRVDSDGRPPVDQGSQPTAVDLGFSTSAGTGTVRKRPASRLLPLVAAAAVLMIVAAWWLRPGSNAPKAPNPQTPSVLAVKAAPDTLTVAYEKIEATGDNIFRYALNLTPDHMLVISVDDLVNNRSLSKKKTIGAEVISQLMQEIRDSGFETLDPLYRGVTPGRLNERSLTIIIGRDARSVRILNRDDVPPAFDAVCTKLESMGKVELGLWAIQYSSEQLIAMAEEAMVQGKKLSTEREIAPGNLAGAISSLNQAEWLLESVERKPAFFQDISSTRTEATAALDTRYEELNFKAEKAINLRDWENAATELRMLLQIIPDREDKRHQTARKQLIEVEERWKPAR